MRNDGATIRLMRKKYRKEALVILLAEMGSHIPVVEVSHQTERKGCRCPFSVG